MFRKELTEARLSTREPLHSLLPPGQPAAQHPRELQPTSEKSFAHFEQMVDETVEEEQDLESEYCTYLQDPSAYGAQQPRLGHLRDPGRYWGFLCLLLGVLPYAWSRQDIWLSEKEISYVGTPIPGVFAFMEHLQKKCCTCLLDRRCCVSHMDNIHSLVSAGGFLVQRVFTVCASVGKVCSITLRVLINTSPDGGERSPQDGKGLIITSSHST
ncbi:unnamed protein product [Leuciscus chuanchicus]